MSDNKHNQLANVWQSSDNYLIISWQSPDNYLPFTWQLPDNYLAINLFTFWHLGIWCTQLHVKHIWIQGHHRSRQSLWTFLYRFTYFTSSYINSDNVIFTFCKYIFFKIPLSFYNDYINFWQCFYYILSKLLLFLITKYIYI